jgi:hypothetical protein
MSRYNHSWLRWMGSVLTAAPIAARYSSRPPAIRDRGGLGANEAIDPPPAHATCLRASPGRARPVRPMLTRW